MKLYATKTLAEAKELQREFPERVHLASLESLTTFGRAFFMGLNLLVREPRWGNLPSLGQYSVEPPDYDPHLARNASSREQTLRKRKRRAYPSEC